MDTNQFKFNGLWVLLSRVSSFLLGILLDETEGETGQIVWLTNMYATWGFCNVMNEMLASLAEQSSKLFSTYVLISHRV